MKHVLAVLTFLTLSAFFLLPAAPHLQAADVAAPDAQPAAQMGPQCPGFLPSRLVINAQGRVTPGLPNMLRDNPSRNARALMTIPGGGVFTVLNGAVCDPVGAAWWQVNYNGVIGWTMEGQGNVYWLEPYAGSGCIMSPRLSVGRTGQVTPGLPNTLRSQPVTGVMLGQIPGGDTFTVVGGPQCVSGVWWWQVTYHSLTGWTAEGQNGVYWLTPVACPNTPPSRLMAGTQARVTPGLPNSLRSQPASGYVVGQIPGGGVFTVVSGPQCASDGRLWWQVNYAGLLGWTAEGEGTTYWLEPLTQGGPTPSNCTMTPRLAPGLSGQVTPGLPNTLRSQPGGGSILGQIPGSSYFRVLSGPQCAGGIWWWQVQYGSVSGWTGEGQSNTYWLTPVVCPASPASRLIPGMWGRVTPGLPNALRSLPGAGYSIMQVPGGGTFAIIGGPQCGPDGRLWWQINYGGVIGWTAEGEGATYWLEPA